MAPGGRLLRTASSASLAVAQCHSSASGKAYQVRCAGAAAVDAGPWLKGELKALRSNPDRSPAKY